MKMYRPHRLCPRNSKPKEPSLYRSLCVSILCMFLSTVMLVGTTFAWFYSSATSAVSTITAGGLNVSASYITQNTARAYAKSTSTTGSDGATTTTTTYDDIPSAAWIPFDGNGGNPFGSIPFHSNDAQVIFLKLTNNGASDATYRLALNLLGDTSVSANSGNTENSLSSLLRYGCNALGSVPTGSTESNFLSVATIPGATTSADGSVTYGAEINPSESSSSVEMSDIFVDALSSHSSTTIERDDNNEVTRITYGGHICKVDLSANETKYIAVSLYMPNGSSYGESTALVYIQLSMTVNQLNAENPLMPNVVGSNAITQQDLEAALSVMCGNLLSEDEIPVVDEIKPVEDSSETDTETPAKPGDATDQPATGTNTTETPSGSTGETGTPSGASGTGTTSDTSGTSDTDTSGGNGDAAAAGSESEPAPAPTT